MHEFAVVMDIIRIVNEEAKACGLRKVTRINIVVGELSSMMDESVQMYFEIMAKDSAMADAVLKFEHKPAMLKCLDCGKEFGHEGSFKCPACSGSCMLIGNTGREFYIRSFEGE